MRIVPWGVALTHAPQETREENPEASCCRVTDFLWKSLAFGRPIDILVKTMGTRSTIHLIRISGLIGRLALLLRR
jgi:hypothetical protein